MDARVPCNLLGDHRPEGAPRARERPRLVHVQVLQQPDSTAQAVRLRHALRDEDSTNNAPESQKLSTAALRQVHGPGAEP